MIDRGALILVREASSAYRGTWRRPLDGVEFRGRRGRELAQRYREALIEGEGVMLDLDEALALCADARKIGIEGCEVVVFETVTNPTNPRSLPLAEAPPAEGLEFYGWDVIETLEPFCSALRDSDLPRNAHGLLGGRAEAEGLARRSSESGDETYEPVRIWIAR